MDFLDSLGFWIAAAWTLAGLAVTVLILLIWLGFIESSNDPSRPVGPRPVQAPRRARVPRP